jgi:hypothetical protein
MMTWYGHHLVNLQQASQATEANRELLFISRGSNLQRQSLPVPDLAPKSLESVLCELLWLIKAPTPTGCTSNPNGLVQVFVDAATTTVKP